MARPSRKILYVVEGFRSGNLRVTRLHVKRSHPGCIYLGWTDIRRRTRWYPVALVGATPESALKKACRRVEVLKKLTGREYHLPV